MKAYKGYSTKVTPQSEPIPGSNQVPNNAGGFVWQLDDWKRLDRFLCLGAEGGTYYVGEHKLVEDNAEAVQRCIKTAGLRVVQRVVDVSSGGLAPKNDPALFALAMCASFGDVQTKQAAFEALPLIARIGTHLFHFLQYVEQFRGWGRGLRSAVANWYAEKEYKDLAYQAVKYQSRDGWSHRDALRLAHPKAKEDSAHQSIYKWIAKGAWDESSPVIIQAFEKAKKANFANQIIKLIDVYNLPRECIPTSFLNDKEVWEALLANMPLTAMVRNLGKMSSIGLLVPMSNAAKNVVEKLSSEEYIHKSRLHPLALLVALKTYQQGRGERGSLSWKPVSQVVDALDNAFYLAFKNVAPTGKRIMLALDVSGSMENGLIAGLPGITPRVGAAAMALITAKVEPNHMVIIFSSAGTGFVPSGRRYYFGDADEVSTFDISPRERLDDVIKRTSRLPFGGTDCALPMLYADKLGIDIDAFLIYTDNETWAGTPHPTQALQAYRRKTGIDAKLVVIGMTANEFSIADPNDAGMLDVVGFSTETPQVISEFVVGRI